MRHRESGRWKRTYRTGFLASVLMFAFLPTASVHAGRSIVLPTWSKTVLTVDTAEEESLNNVSSCPDPAVGVFLILGFIPYIFPKALRRPVHAEME